VPYRTDKQTKLHDDNMARLTSHLQRGSATTLV
jgi:hypothetical protein